MDDTEQLKPEDNHGTNVQLKPAENALSLRKKETPVGSTDGDEKNLASNVPPEYRNIQQSPISDSEHQSNIQGVRVTEATASTALEKGYPWRTVYLVEEEPEITKERTTDPREATSKLSHIPSLAQSRLKYIPKESWNCMAVEYNQWMIQCKSEQSSTRLFPSNCVGQNQDSSPRYQSGLTHVYTPARSFRSSSDNRILIVPTMKKKQGYNLIRQDIANKEAETTHNEHVPKTADPVNNMTSSVQTLPDEIKNLDSSSQPNYAQAKNENGKQIQGQNNQSADSDVSTKSKTHNNEKPLDEAGQQEQQGSTNLSIPTLKEEQHSLTMKKEAVDEGAEHTCLSFKDQEVQCGEDQVNEGKKIPKSPDKLRYDYLSHIVAGIALAVALYTQFISIPNLKPGTPLQTDSGHFPQEKKLTEEFQKRLDSVESSMQNSIASIKDFEERFKKLKAVAYKDDIANLVQKTDFEDQVREIKQHFLDQVSAKVEEVNIFWNQFLKLKDEVIVQFEGISGIKNEQKELKTNVKTLEDQLVKQSQNIEQKTTEVMTVMSQHKEAVHDLNVSLENLESNMKYLTENVTGISIETLVLDKRTEDIKENIFDKGSLIVVIMMDTVLLVVVIIYLAAKRDNNRRFNWNVDIEEQEVNGGAKNSPAPYSTAGRILSQVRAHPRLENKLCVVSFYEETHPLHMRMTQSVTDQLTIQPVEFIIRRHEDILNIPPVVLFFLFVDFNERNVILEDPTLGLGDLRLTTVQAVQKMGGKMVIFYVRDQISKQLHSTKLYNEDLVSVTRQRELSDLNQRSRFISAYDQLTDFQKTHLKRIVGNELTGR